MPDDEPTPETASQLSPVPFLLALVGFAVLVVLAFVFLRTDDEGVLVRPDRLTEVDADTIRAVAIDQPDCGSVERAQVDLAESEIFVELVVVGTDGQCDAATIDIVAEVTLPEAIHDRRLVAGVGRLPLPCAGQRSSVTCALDG